MVYCVLGTIINDMGYSGIVNEYDSFFLESESSRVFDGDLIWN